MAAQQDKASASCDKDLWANICPDKSLDILLVGRTGDGKSAAGNTILRRDVFDTSAGTQSTTKISDYDWCVFEDKYIKVVDSPGLGDTRLDAKDDVQQFIDATKVAMANNPKGYHAILYVIKFGERFTKLDELNVLKLKKLLGDNFMKNHCVILMKFGDCFKTDRDVTRFGLSFENWVKQQKNVHFCKLLKECNQRIILFDNRTKDVVEMKAQIRKLVDIVFEMSKKEKRYSNEDFAKVEIKRQELLIKLSKEKEKQDVMDNFGILISKLKEATDDDAGALQLMEVNQEIDKLFVFVQTKLVKNEMLENTLDLFKYIREALHAKQRQVSNIIGFHSELKSMRDTWETKMDAYKTRNQHTPIEKPEDKKVSATTQLTAKEKEKIDQIQEKELDLNYISNEISEFDRDFKTTREKDKSKTNKKIEQLEKRYKSIKIDEKYGFMGALFDFIVKSLFPIRKVISLLSDLRGN